MLFTSKEKKVRISKGFRFQQLKDSLSILESERNTTAKPLPEELADFETLKGRPLPLDIRLKMETFFHANFADVRVHVGPQAASLDAIAFACGSDLYFTPGKYNPYTTEGLQLLGHELAHVVQQREGRVSNPFGKGVVIIQDPSLEAEADWMGMELVSMNSRQLKPQGLPAKLSKVSPRLKGKVIQCVLTEFKKMTGPNGDKVIFKEGEKYYFKSITRRADDKEAWKEVVIENDKYKLTGGADLLVDKAPTTAKGWSEGKIVDAFKKGGAQVIRDYEDYFGFQVHATTHRENGEYPSFHVKFDASLGDWISRFYYYDRNKDPHWGQNDYERRKIIKNFTKNNSDENYNQVMDDLWKEASRISRALFDILDY